MKKKLTKNLLRMLLGMLVIAFGVNGSVFMAVSGNLPDAGITSGGEPGGTDGTSVKTDGNVDGIATETYGRTEGDPEMYTKDIDKRITKIRPMATPVDQISRHGKYLPTESFVCKYYSVGTRPIKTTLTEAIEKQTQGSSVVLKVKDPAIFTLDDTIRVVGVKGKFDYKGVAYEADKSTTPDLVLCVCGRDPATNNPIVYAVNGEKETSTQQTIWLPAIPADTVLVRMGKACGELDVQTGRFNNLPTSEEQYCQNFMIQIEQSTFDKIASKEVDWNFSDIEEDGIYDMRLAQENTFLFGSKNMIKHVTKDNMATWFTGGIWYQAGKDIEVGHWDTNTKKAVISDDDLVDISKDLFVGTGLGNKRKVLFVGSDMLEAFSSEPGVYFALPRTDFEKLSDRFPEERSYLYDEEHEFDLGGGTIVESLPVPGHTAGSVVFFLDGRDIMFSGDAIGSGHGVWIFDRQGFENYVKGLNTLNAYLDGSDIDRQALRIFGGHFWQKDWFPELGDGEFGIS